MATDLPASIRIAHAALVAEGHHDLGWVSLAKLRPRLGDVYADELNDALWAMHQEPDGNAFLDTVRPHGGSAGATPEELAAAVRRGNLDYPYLAIR